MAPQFLMAQHALGHRIAAVRDCLPYDFFRFLRRPHHRSRLSKILQVLIETLPLIFDLLEFDEIDGEGGSIYWQPGKAMMKVESFSCWGNGVNDDEPCRDFGGSAE